MHKGYFVLKRSLRILKTTDPTWGALKYSLYASDALHLHYHKYLSNFIGCFTCFEYGIRFLTDFEKGGGSIFVCNFFNVFYNLLSIYPLLWTNFVIL